MAFIGMTAVTAGLPAPFKSFTIASALQTATEALFARDCLLCSAFRILVCSIALRCHGLFVIYHLLLVLHVSTVLILIFRCRITTCHETTHQGSKCHHIKKSLLHNILPSVRVGRNFYV